MEKLQISQDTWLMRVYKWATNQTKTSVKYYITDICQLRTELTYMVLLILFNPILFIISRYIFKFIEQGSKMDTIIRYLLTYLLAFFIGVMYLPILFGSGGFNLNTTFNNALIWFYTMPFFAVLFIGFIVLLLFTGSYIVELYNKINIKPIKIIDTKPYKEMYKSWREKYCTPIEFITKKRIIK